MNLIALQSILDMYSTYGLMGEVNSTKNTSIPGGIPYKIANFSYLKAFIQPAYIARAISWLEFVVAIHNEPYLWKFILARFAISVDSRK